MFEQEAHTDPTHVALFSFGSNTYEVFKEIVRPVLILPDQALCHRPSPWASWHPFAFIHTCMPGSSCLHPRAFFKPAVRLSYPFLVILFPV
jgi:hypothetical protein